MQRYLKKIRLVVTFLKEVPRRKLIRREFSIDDNDIDFVKVVIPDKRKRKLTEQENNRTKRQIIENEVEFIKQVPQNPLSSFRIKIKALLRFSLVRDPNQMEKEDLSGIIKNSSKKVSRDCLDEM